MTPRLSTLTSFVRPRSGVGSGARDGERAQDLAVFHARTGRVRLQLDARQIALRRHSAQQRAVAGDRNRRSPARASAATGRRSITRMRSVCGKSAWTCRSSTELYGAVGLVQDLLADVEGGHVPRGALERGPDLVAVGRGDPADLHVLDGDEAGLAQPQIAAARQHDDGDERESDL